jgi:two-component system C4-dicarboxylate transport sensor histidine kinase DctB
MSGVDEEASAIEDAPSADGSVGRIAWLAELGVMTASLLHEMRQPLFAIKAMVELEVVDREPARAARLRKVLEQVEHLEDLLANHSLLGRTDDEATAFDLSLPVQIAVDMLGHKAKSAHATLRASLPEQEERVTGRQGAIRQVLVNLIHNAIDAVAGQAQRQVDVWLGHDAVGAIVEVRDTGAGIPVEMLDRVFEPFVTTKPEGRGTGLGLFIARTTARQSGGDVEIASTSSLGTVVRLRLPRSLG